MQSTAPQSNASKQFAGKLSIDKLKRILKPASKNVSQVNDNKESLNQLLNKEIFKNYDKINSDPNVNNPTTINNLASLSKAHSTEVELPNIKVNKSAENLKEFAQKAVTNWEFLLPN